MCVFCRCFTAQDFDHVIQDEKDDSDLAEYLKANPHPIVPHEGFGNWSLDVEPGQELFVELIFLKTTKKWRTENSKIMCTTTGQSNRQQLGDNKKLDESLDERYEYVIE